MQEGDGGRWVESKRESAGIASRHETDDGAGEGERERERAVEITYTGP